MTHFLIVKEPNTGVIQVTQSGSWSPAIVDAYFAALAPLVREIRAAGRAVRILSDRRECPVQSPETVDRAGFHADRMFVPRDKVALIVQSSLVKLQIRREYSDDIFGMFLSAKAAATWLSAFGVVEWRPPSPVRRMH